MSDDAAASAMVGVLEGSTAGSIGTNKEVGLGIGSVGKGATLDRPSVSREDTTVPISGVNDTADGNIWTVPVGFELVITATGR
jgi:hypothetical protein